MPVGPEPEIVTLFEQLVDVLTPLDIRYAFIGAMARNAWGRPRTTTDLDLEMALDDAALRSLEEALRASGGERIPSDGLGRHAGRPDCLQADRRSPARYG